MLKMLELSAEEMTHVETMINYLLTYSIRRINLPGVAETFCIIMDLDKVGITQMPVRGLKNFLGAVQTNFRGRGYKTFIVNAGMMVRGSWSMIKPVLDEFTAQKINILAGDFKTKIPAFIQVDQLEQRFGGILPDKKSNFFPPDMRLEEEEMLSM